MAIDCKCSTNYRPARIAFLFSEEDVTTLLRVIRYACTQSGGINNTLIPIRSDCTLYPFFEDILRTQEPDIFILSLPDVDAGDSKFEKLRSLLKEMFPHRYVWPHIGEHFEKVDPYAHSLSTIMPLSNDRDVYTTDPPFTPRQATRHAFSGSDADQLALTAIFGQIYTGQESEYSNHLHLVTKDISCGDANFWKFQFQDAPVSSILNLTSFGIHPREVSGPTDDIVFNVIVGSSVPQICVYWDIRAIQNATSFFPQGRRVLLFPDSLVQDVGALQSLLRFIRAAPPVPDSSSSCDVSFFCENAVATKSFEEQLLQITGIEKTQKLHWNRWSGNTKHVSRQEDHERTLNYLLNYLCLPQAYKNGYGQAPLPRPMNIVPGNVEILLDPPAGFQNRFHQGVVVDLMSDVWDRFPKSHAVANSVSSGAWFSNHGCSISLSVTDQPTYFSFQFPEDRLALRTHFKELGFDTRPSDKGQYGHAILKLLGGLEGVKEIADRETYDLLKLLSLKSSKKVAQYVIQQMGWKDVDEVAIAQSLANIDMVPELKRVPKSVQDLTSSLRSSKAKILRILKKLSAFAIVKRGMHLECPQCGTPTWYHIEQIAESIMCMGCSFRFALPVEYPAGSGIEPTWEYTLNTLANRAMDQDLFSVLFAVSYAAGSERIFSLEPGFELIKKGDSNVFAEFDFIFVRKQRIFAGEVKAGNEIEDKDLKAARLAAKLGFRAYWFCSAIGFSDSSKSKISTLNSEEGFGREQCEIKFIEANEMFNTPKHK